MPTHRFYLTGLTAGVPPGVNNHPRAKRGIVGGWSESSTRANTRFLYSVEHELLTGYGYAATFTVRTCPDSHEDWKRARELLFMRFRRMGMIRCHWVTEWQRRGVPHLHLAVWFEQLHSENSLREAWLRIAAPYRPVAKAQQVKPIRDAVGWFQYLSKHASRGLRHYQRSPEGIPAGWQRTGRMWGAIGSWPTREALVFDLETKGFHAYRRIVRAWRVAGARAQGDQVRLGYARRMLRCDDPGLSAVRGISEWIPIDVSLTMLANVAMRGFRIEQLEG